MRREVKLSLMASVLVIGFVLLLGVVGFSCEIWTHAALSSAKKVGAKVLLRVVYHLDFLDLPVDSLPFLVRFLNLSI